MRERMKALAQLDRNHRRIIAGQPARLTTCQRPRFSLISRLRARGREESAEQPVPLELLLPSLPALSTTTQPLEDCRQIRRNRGLRKKLVACRPGDWPDETAVPSSIS